MKRHYYDGSGSRGPTLVLPWGTFRLLRVSPRVGDDTGLDLRGMLGGGVEREGSGEEWVDPRRNESVAVNGVISVFTTLIPNQDMDFHESLVHSELDGGGNP